jgi:transcriptional regulator with XRE-family HTH domain
MAEDLRRWGEAVSAALRERRMSNNAAAQAVGVSPATFSAWVNGATRPNVEALPRIAEVTGVSLWRLHELAGYLPEDYSPATAVIEAVNHQRSFYQELRRWAARSEEAIGLSPAARAAGLIVDHDPGWQVTIRPNLKGIEYAVASNTLLGLVHTRTPAAPLHTARVALEEAIGSKLATLGLLWRGRTVPGWPDAPPLVLEVPEHERTRGRGAAPAPGFPPTILVVGVPYAHAELVGSLLAEAIDYGYLNMRTEACIHGELGMGASAAEVEAATAQLVRLHRHQGPSLLHTVWTCSYPEAVAELSERDLLASRTHVLHVRARPELVEYGAGVWGYPRETCLDTGKRLDALVDALGPGRSTVVELATPDGLAADEQAPHRVADAAVRAALQALPALNPDSGGQRWKGYLGSVSRRISSRGR